MKRKLAISIGALSLRFMIVRLDYYWTKPLLRTIVIRLTTSREWLW